MGMDLETLSLDLVSLLTPLGLELHDLEMAKGLVRVTVNRDGGVSLEDLTAANHEISTFLDEHEPMNARYRLEVTSPGVERKLRTPAHFVGAVGEQVRIKTTPDASVERRVEGTLQEATDDTMTIVLENGDSVTLRFDQIDRARTVYAWGPQSKPSPSRGGGSNSKRAKTPSVPERIMTS